MQIRPFKQADRSAVLGLWHTADLVRPWNDPAADLDRSLHHDASTVFVAVETGPDGHARVIGTVMVGYDGHRGWINLLAVETDRRGRGVGAALVAAAEDRLRSWDCPKVNLQIRADNRAVVDFYRGVGYTVDHVVGMGRRLHADLPGLDHLHVMGDLWHADEPRRTELGRLIEAGDDEEVAARLSRFAEDRVADLVPEPAVVVAIPADPGRPRPLPALLARAAAAATGLTPDPGLLARRASTPRLRDAVPADRPALARAARYEVTRSLDGDTVVLVDDVVLTGTTLSHVAQMLTAAGAGSVVGLVAGRTRRV